MTRHWALKTRTHATLIPVLIPASLPTSKQPKPRRQSDGNQANQAGKQPKQTAGEWAMVGQCSHRPDVTSGWGGLMTNWCLRSITASTLPTPVGRLNGSILSAEPSPCSLPFSLSLKGLQPPFSLSVWARGRHRGSLIASYFPWNQVHYINSSDPRCILSTCCNLFLYLLGWQKGSFPLSWARQRNCGWVREKVRGRSAGAGIHCDAPARQMKTWRERGGDQGRSVRDAKARSSEGTTRGRSEAVLSPSVNISFRRGGGHFLNKLSAV